MRRLNDGENTTWRVTPHRGPEAVLRLHRAGYHTDRSIEAELAWLRALAADEPGAAPEPRATPDGHFLVGVKVGVAQTRRAASLLTWTQGRFTSWPGSPAALRKIGRLAARLHTQSRAWKSPAKRRRAKLAFEDHVGADCHWGASPLALPSLRSSQRDRLRGVLADVRARIEEARPRLGSGLIHGDLHLGNVLIDGDVARAIDFDDAVRSWWVVDPAVTLLAASLNADAERRVAAFWTGYEEQGGCIHANHHALLPTVQIVRLVSMLAWSWTRRANARIAAHHKNRQRLTLAACRRWVRTGGRALDV